MAEDTVQIDAGALPCQPDRRKFRQDTDWAGLWFDIMEKEELLFSSKLACPECGFSIDELAPRMFSFNSPFGACPECDGLGAKMIVDPDLLVPDTTRTIDSGAFEAWAGSTSNYYPQFLNAVCLHYGIPTDVPVSTLTTEQMKKLMFGTGGERVKFQARLRLQQVICNVYTRNVWERVEHYHSTCYELAGNPYGEPKE